MSDLKPYSELKRKAEHIIPLGFAFTLTVFPKWLVFTLAITAILYGLFLSRRLVKGTLREAERTRGFSLGKTAYGVMILILLLIFHNNMQVVAGAWALLALGDGAATLFGTLMDSPRLPWNAAKSWAGLFGFLLIGVPACVGLLWYTQTTGQVGQTINAAFANFSFRQVAAIGLGVTIVCAVAESIDQPLDDNILIPALAGGLLFPLTT